MILKNSKENATITLISRQVADGDEDKLEFTTSGGFYKKEGKFFITYNEHSDMGMGDSRVLLKIEPNTITMRRMGDFATVMVYKKDETTEFIYRVPFGELNMKIKTQSIVNALDDEGGRLSFSYMLYSGEAMTKTNIDIYVKTERDKL